MLNLNSVMIGTMQTKVMFSFYEKVLGAKPDMVEEDWAGWKLGASFLSIGKHDHMGGMAKDAGRIMFNLETDQVKEEYARMVAVGAKSIKEPYEIGGMWVATLADPDGNYFQLMSPWKE